YNQPKKIRRSQLAEPAISIPSSSPQPHFVSSLAATSPRHFGDPTNLADFVTNRCRPPSPMRSTASISRPPPRLPVLQSHGLCRYCLLAFLDYRNRIEGFCYCEWPISVG
ncbi:hypothetical protein LINPERHAP2_LOCUS13250, partial [Linum perenne]